MKRLRIITCAPASAGPRARHVAPRLDGEIDAWRDVVERLKRRWSDLGHRAETPSSEDLADQAGTRDVEIIALAITRVEPGFIVDGELADTTWASGWSEDIAADGLRWLTINLLSEMPEDRSWWEFTNAIQAELFVKEGDLDPPDAIWLDITHGERRLVRALTLAAAHRSVVRVLGNHERLAFPALRFSSFDTPPETLLELDLGYEPDVEEVPDLLLCLETTLASTVFAGSLDARGLGRVSPAWLASRTAQPANLGPVAATASLLGGALRLGRVHELEARSTAVIACYQEVLMADSSSPVRNPLVMALDEVNLLAQSLRPASQPRGAAEIGAASTPSPSDFEVWADLEQALRVVPVLIRAGHEALAALIAREIYVELGYVFVRHHAIAPRRPPTHGFDAWVAHHAARLQKARPNDPRARELFQQWRELEKLAQAGSGVNPAEKPVDATLLRLPTVRNRLAHVSPRRPRQGADEMHGSVELHTIISALASGIGGQAAWIDSASSLYQSLLAGASPKTQPDDTAVAVVVLDWDRGNDAGDHVVVQHIWAMAPTNVRARIALPPVVARIPTRDLAGREQRSGDRDRDPDEDAKWWRRQVRDRVLVANPTAEIVVFDCAPECSFAAASELIFSGVDIYGFERGQVVTDMRGPYTLTGSWRPLWLGPDPEVTGSSPEPVEATTPRTHDRAFE